MGAKLVFVPEIPARRKVWKAPSWVKALRRDKWLQIPCATRSLASSLRSQLVRAGFHARTRSVNGTVYVFAKKVEK